MSFVTTGFSIILHRHIDIINQRVLTVKITTDKRRQKHIHKQSLIKVGMINSWIAKTFTSVVVHFLHHSNGKHFFQGVKAHSLVRAIGYRFCHITQLSFVKDSFACCSRHFMYVLLIQLMQ